MGKLSPHAAFVLAIAWISRLTSVLFLLYERGGDDITKIGSLLPYCVNKAWILIPYIYTAQLLIYTLFFIDYDFIDHCLV